MEKKGVKEAISDSMLLTIMHNASPLGLGALPHAQVARINEAERESMRVLCTEYLNLLKRSVALVSGIQARLAAEDTLAVAAHTKWLLHQGFLEPVLGTIMRDAKHVRVESLRPFRFAASEVPVDVAHPVPVEMSGGKMFNVIGVKPDAEPDGPGLLVFGGAIFIESTFLVRRIPYADESIAILRAFQQ